eukprot:gene9506-12806_t
MPGRTEDSGLDPTFNPSVTKISCSPTSVQVDDRVYDATKLAEVHPGGELFVRVFAGRDATEAFLSYHRREFPHSKMTEALIGQAISKKEKNADEEYLELCKLIEQVLPRNKSFAPTSYFIKLFVILASAISLEFYIHYTKSYVWYLTGPLGWLFALIGLNIQHDSNHGAISRNPFVNRLLGLTQNWIGGSSLDWIHQHVVQHHIHCNDTSNDPDIVGNPILRLNPLKPLMKFHLFQYIYLFVLLGLFGFSYTIGSLQHVSEGFHLTKMSSLVDSYRSFEGFTILFFFFRWLVFPVLQVPTYMTFVNILPMFLIGGYYLSFFFVISHNFEGVMMFDQDSTKGTKFYQSFLRTQIATSSNVGGSFLCFLNGGLNYQIEHHLFPRIQHTHYPIIAPIVREFCEKRNIPYRHFPTIHENVLSCAKHLYEMGTKEKPAYYLASNKANKQK